MSFGQKICVVLIAIFAVGMTAGCKEDPMRRGAVALGAENADEAQAAFEEALKANPDNFEAKRLMADVHILRKEFKKAEEQLDKLWAEQGFDKGDDGLSPDQKAARELMEGQYRNLFKTWAEEVDSAADAEQFERVIRKGLEYDPKSVRLNTLAVGHFTQQAERLVEEGKKAEAAAAYEAVLDFRAPKNQREEAQKNADKLRFEAFGEAFDKTFEETKKELVAAGTWDDEKKVVIVKVEADVDKSLRGNNPEDVKKAQGQSAQATAVALRNIVVKTAGLDADADFSKAGPPAAEIASTDLRRGKLEMELHLSPEAIKKNAFDVLEAKRKAEAEDKPEGDDADADSGDEAADSADAGTEGDGGK